MKARASTVATAYNNRANARMAKGDFAGAVNDYTKAIELQPADEENYYNRGVAQQARGDYEAAIADFSKARLISFRNLLSTLEKKTSQQIGVHNESA